jgi:hypothetical protein
MRRVPCRTVSASELAIVLGAVVLGSVVKAVTGMGLPLIAVPVAALFVDLVDAVVVIALPNVLANIVLGTREWDSRHETRDLPVLAVAGAVGAVFGTLALVNVSETALLLAWPDLRGPFPADLVRILRPGDAKSSRLRRSVTGSWPSAPDRRIEDVTWGSSAGRDRCLRVGCQRLAVSRGPKVWRRSVVSNPVGMEPVVAYM